jgi:hypothetical protein
MKKFYVFIGFLLFFGYSKHGKQTGERNCAFED